jgi:hypothetical protein
MMVKAWYADHISWATTWALMEKSSPTHQLAITANGEQRQPMLPSHTQKGFGKKGKDAGKNYNSKPDWSETVVPPAKFPRMTETALGQPSFDALLKGSNRAEAVDKMYNLYSDQTRQFFLGVCRNCFLAGKGQVKHTFFQCQKLGNECVMQCVKCKLGNHWVSQCKA